MASLIERLTKEDPDERMREGVTDTFQQVASRRLARRSFLNLTFAAQRRLLENGERKSRQCNTSFGKALR
jgi:hypothetical protein